MIYERSNFLIVISAPSGGGKTTICQAILNEMPEIDYSISYTTRPPRKNEMNGESYFFVSEEQFRAKIEDDELLEYAEVHGNLYGTSRSFILEKFSRNRNVIMDIDVQGAVSIMKSGIECVTIFLLPPDMATLRERLYKRDSDADEIIELRLKNANREINEIEKYHYLVINDKLDQAVADVKSIITAEQNRVTRYISPASCFVETKRQG